MQIFFASLIVVYAFMVIVLLSNIDENLISFLFSTVNWKQTLRDELWDIPLHKQFKISSMS